jgi:hypothetical protein
MDEQTQHTNKPEDVAALLSATKPVAGEQFRLQLEERLVSKLQARHAYAAQAAREQTSAAADLHAHSLPKRAAVSSGVSALRVGFGPRVGRVASVGMGVVGIALLALLFVGMSALLQSRQTREGGPVGPSETSEPTATSTPAGVDIGGAYMLDPQGDVELAKRVIEQAVESGTPQVILSRRVSGGELPCLGFGGMTDIEMRPTDSFGLVVLKGNLRPFPRLPLTVVRVYAEGYTQYLYDEQSAAISAWGPLNWGTLRATFGGFRWPPDSPMYLSPDGQPGFAELDLWELNPDSKSTDVRVAQTLNGWTVTASRVYALGNSILVAYTIVGPNPRDRFMVERPVLEVEGLRVDGTVNQLRGEVMGPSVDLTGFGGLPSSAQPREVNMRFVVPAIHVRPPKYPCEVPGLKPEDYPTPTPIPNDPFAGGAAAPAPDVETVGPFTLNLKVVVEPRPTQPALPPPPEPSRAVPNIPPVPTGPLPPDATLTAIASTVVPTAVPTGSSAAPTPTMAPDFPAIARGLWEPVPGSTLPADHQGRITNSRVYAIDFAFDGVSVRWDNGLTCPRSSATVSGDTLWVIEGDILAVFKIHDADDATVTFWQGDMIGELRLRKTRDDPFFVCY